MSEETASAVQRVEHLRSAFDRAFAEPAQVAAAATERFLSLRIGAEAFALPMAAKSAHLSALLADRTIVRLPSQTPEFLGLAGVRGEIVPVFDLARFVGRVGAGSLRWLAVARLPEPAALAFEDMEGLVDLATGDILPAPINGDEGSNVRRVVRRAGSLSSVLDLDAIAEAIRRSARRTTLAAAL